MSRKIVSMQIRVTDDLRERAKAVAKQKGLTLSELMLQLLASTGDKQLKDLVKKELKEVILVDYKSNKVLFKPVYNQLYPPFQRFGETPFNKYQIQLNLYQWILEQIKGIKISKRIIVHFTEDSFIPYAVEDLQKEIKLIVNNNFSNQLLWQPLVN